MADHKEKEVMVGREKELAEDIAERMQVVCRGAEEKEREWAGEEWAGEVYLRHFSLPKWSKVFARLSSDVLRIKRSSSVCFSFSPSFSLCFLSSIFFFF